MELLTVGGGCDGRGWEGWELYSGRSAQTWLLVYLSVCCFCLGLPRETKKRSFSSLQAGPPVLPVCAHFPQLCSTISYKIVLMLKLLSISVSIHLYFLTCFWPCNCIHKVFLNGLLHECMWIAHARTAHSSCCVCCWADLCTNVNTCD